MKQKEKNNETQRSAQLLNLCQPKTGLFLVKHQRNINKLLLLSHLPIFIFFFISRPALIWDMGTSIRYKHWGTLETITHEQTPQVARFLPTRNDMT